VILNYLAMNSYTIEEIVDMFSCRDDTSNYNILLKALVSSLRVIISLENIFLGRDTTD